MEKNHNALTLSQALKLYNGSSLPKLTVQLAGCMVLYYVGSIFIFTVLIGLDRGFAAAHEEVCKTLMSNMYFAIVGGITIAVFSLFTYEKLLPGGKFFRTVKGGFDTYKKMRTAFELSTSIALCLYSGIICVINAIIPIMEHGTGTCISVAVFLLLGECLTNFINTIKNGLARSVLNLLILFALSLVGVFTAYFNSGTLSIVHVTAAILAIVLMPISHNLMLANYKKYRWDN